MHHILYFYNLICSFGVPNICIFFYKFSQNTKDKKNGIVKGSTPNKKKE